MKCKMIHYIISSLWKHRKPYYKKEPREEKIKRLTDQLHRASEDCPDDWSPTEQSRQEWEEYAEKCREIERQLIELGVTL